jgi:hypothetical protein
VLHPARAPLYGLYEVEGFSRNGKEIPPLTTDTTRWKRMILQYTTAASVRMMNDSAKNFGAEYDAANNRLTLITQADKQKHVFQYSRPDSEHVVLDGKLNQDQLVVRLRRVDTQKFLLLNRGFNWINERPFNR